MVFSNHSKKNNFQAYFWMNYLSIHCKNSVDVSFKADLKIKEKMEMRCARSHDK